MKFLWLATLLLTIAPAYSAEVIEIHGKNLDQLPKGKEADGIIGDFVLRNDKVSALISGNSPLRRPNMSAFYGDGNETPGCLYDLSLRNATNDQITIFSPCFQKGKVSYVEPLTDLPDGEAGVETFTSAAKNLGLSISHQYRLKEGWQGILITSTFHNTTDQTKTQNIYDHWTQMRLTGQIKDIRWADAIDPDDKCGYAVGWVAENGGIEFVNKRITKRAGRELNVEIQPNERVIISRFLAIGHSPAEAVGEVAARKTPELVDEVHLTLAGDHLERVSLDLDPTNKNTPPAYAVDGALKFKYFKGDYTAALLDNGRVDQEVLFSIEHGAPHQSTVKLPPQARVHFEITTGDNQDTPCKVQFHPAKGTGRPNLGPTDRAAGCSDQWHSATGKFSVGLPSGEYRVVVSRGPEYSLYRQQIKLTPETEVTVKGKIDRVIDTTGWVSTDFHNHSTPSGDNTCGTPDRLINLAAEHIEFAPTTEHNRQYDWQPQIDELGLSSHLNTVPGLELTGRGAHINCFPLKPEPEKQDGGAPVWEVDPRVNTIHLRDWQGGDPTRWIHVNHPDLSENFIDRNRDGKPDGGFAYLGEMLDGLETQNYKDAYILEKAPFAIEPVKGGLGKKVKIYREFIWLQLLNQGLRTRALAVADAHHVYGNGVGSWRTYIPSSTDAPKDISWEEISANAKAGHMVLSSGPYLEVRTADGAIAGDETLIQGGKVALQIKVQAPDYMDVDLVQVLVNSRQDPKLRFTTETHPEMFRDDQVIRFEETLNVQLSEDAHLIVVATSEHGNLSALYGTSSQSAYAPCAYNNPIYIDIDGDGFTPNGDTLGYDLPVGGLGVGAVEKLLGK